MSLTWPPSRERQKRNNRNNFSLHNLDRLVSDTLYLQYEMKISKKKTFVSLGQNRPMAGKA